MKRMKFIKTTTIVWLIIFTLIIQSVVALGIRPAKTNINFEEIQNHSGIFWVVNNEMRTFDMKIHVEESSLSSFLSLQKEDISFKNSDEALPVRFVLNLPEEIPMGNSIINIILEEILEDKSPNVISSKIVLKHKINVQGPYPDKFAIAKLNFQERSDFFELISEVENKGKEEINKIQTKFFVNDKEQKEHVLETDSISLKPKENQLLRAKLDKNLLVLGEYEVKSLISYDDQNIEVIKTLRFGEPEVDIVYFDKYFMANKINKYALELLNKWNKKVENVYVNVEVKKDDQKIDEFRTKSVNIDRFMTKKINDYFDAKDKNPGTYVFEMVINFWNTYRMDSKIFSAELLSEEEYGGLGAELPKGEDLNEKFLIEETSSTKPWLITSFVFLLLVLIGYMIYRYKNRDKYENEEEELF